MLSGYYSKRLYKYKQMRYIDNVTLDNRVLLRSYRASQNEESPNTSLVIGYWKLVTSYQQPVTRKDSR